MLERLRKIENLEQRQLLKDVIQGVLFNLVDYQEKMNEQLEQRVFNEIEDWESNYDIYATVCPLNQIDPIHEYLFPIFPSDLETSGFNTKEIVEAIENQQSVRLCTIFLQCDSLEIQQLLKRERIFTGQLVTNDGTLQIKVKLEQNKKYIQEIEKLYTIFQINGLPWKTVNNPYIYKFVDCVLIDFPTVKEEIEIVDINIDLEEYDDKKRFDMIPLWNIERMELKNTGFPYPAIDKVNFEHLISIEQYGNHHAYLVASDEETIRYVKRTKNELTIVSPMDKSGTWNVYKIANIENDSKELLDYPLVSNRRTNQFLHRYVNKYSIELKTKGEIFRLIQSFEASKLLELVDIKILDDFKGGTTNTYLNFFLKDSISYLSAKKVLLLEFTLNEPKSFITNDILNFLVSEVQRHFLEYRCEGTWV